VDDAYRTLADPCFVCAQVVSFGPVGILGRVGWFCIEADVEHWNALAGWRGLRDPDVLRHFNGTILAFERDWGDVERSLSNLGLRYAVAYLGADAAADAIRARLDTGLAALFYLWSPHPFHSRYRLNRIQLPEYTPELFEQGLSDYPTDVVEKVASKQLAEFAPAVAEMYARFQIGNSAQESMLARMDAEELSAMQAVCAWMRQEENAALWQAWVPAEKHTCEAGHYAVDATSCAPCMPGSSSIGGTATACLECSAGARPLAPCSTLSLNMAVLAGCLLLSNRK
jgi:hypothetical protein